MVSDRFIYLLKTDAGCKEGHVSLALCIGFSLTSRRGEDYALDHGTNEKDGVSNSWKEALFSKNVPRSSKVRVSQLKKLLSRPISPHSTSLWSSRRLFICSQSNGSNMAPHDGFAVSAAGNELRHAYRICTIVAGLLPTRWRHRYSRRWLGTCKCASFCFEKGMACILLRTLFS
jgi:hypothetical protein